MEKSVTVPLPSTVDITAYFAVRNGVKIYPLDRVHYTKDKLKSYLTSGTCDYIAGVIATNLLGYPIIDYNPSIGQLTLALVNRDVPLTVISSGIDSGFVRRNFLSYKMKIPTILNNLPKDLTNGIGIVYNISDENIFAYTIYVLNSKQSLPRTHTETKVGDAWLYMPILVNPNTVPVVEIENSEAEKSTDAYVSHIRNLNIVDPEDYDLYFGPDAHLIWRQSHTHISYDPEINYEKLEYLGDLVIKLAFADYILSIFPGLSEKEATNLGTAYLSRKEITNLDNYYMGKKFQGLIARAYGLDTFLLAKIPITSKQREDLIEAFFGAIYKIDRLKGLRYARRMMDDIFTANPIDKSAGMGDNKSIFQQLIERLGFTKNFISSEIVELNGTYTVYITIESSILRSTITETTGAEIEELVGSGVGTTVRQAEENAFAKAIENTGLNIDNVGKKRENVINYPELKPYNKDFQKKMKSLEIDSAKRKVLTTGTDEIYHIQLIGTKADGTEIIMGEAESGSYDQSSILVVLDFLNRVF